MEITERIDDGTLSFEIAYSGAVRGVWKVIPIIAQQSDGHTMSAQAAVQPQWRKPDGTHVPWPLSIFMDVPVHYPGGGGVSHTHPVKQGDEGLVVFTDRNQDSWYQNGGTNNPLVDDRAHHLADGRYIPGGRSLPRKMDPAPSTTSQQNRSDDGKHVMDLHPQNGITHASIEKVLSIVGGQQGVAILHTVQNIIANAAQGNVLLQTVKASGIPPPGQMVIADAKLVVGQALPAISSLAQSIMSSILG